MDLPFTLGYGSGSLEQTNPDTTNQSANLEIETTFLVVSDTHSKEWIEPGKSFPAQGVDVAIHCGGLTKRWTLAEFTQAVEVLKRINAPLKLVLAGDHDFNLGLQMFRTIHHDPQARPPIWSEEHNAAPEDYGYIGEAKKLFSRGLSWWKNAICIAGEDNINLLGTGKHDFVLKNGAKLRVYANPHTPSANSEGGLRFQRDEHHKYAIGPDVDVVVTQGPPRGILDTNMAGEQSGCDDLLAAVASARPRMHCFGHVHEGWGAELVTWHGTVADPISKRQPIETLASLNAARLRRTVRNTVQTQQGYIQTSLCGRVTWREENDGRAHRELLRPGEQTLFVNAALKKQDEGEMPLPWVVVMRLPIARRSTWAELYHEFFRRFHTFVSGEVDA
jgi:hypothetical protein